MDYNVALVRLPIYPSVQNVRGSEFVIYVHKDRIFIVMIGTSLSKSAFEAISAIILRHIAGKV